MSVSLTATLGQSVKHKSCQLEANCVSNAHVENPLPLTGTGLDTTELVHPVMPCLVHS